ncbi:NADPH-dependent sulfur oxidoreductase D subunit [Thermobacillus xylanilyticus]|uniref:NADPH-dependent sulfur oxidoreductase D subunit n=1 Tax=Thermobacillus xylanilyticus TaxID=76633 RepID=A0ABM8V5Q1_THEXY|nr:nitroreductase family protein [Thermobacillus xylanilyticus]CAG5089264.1 NADPH-dependent sulfur oxidoreductase D subunit [Thermobacillus xylanilyticus]
MDVLAAIEKRREITQFKSDPIPQDVMDKLSRALYLAPSGNNLPSREFILITEKEMLRKLTPTTPYMQWLEQAAGAVVIIADPALSKYWLQDASIAGGFAWLTAVSLGLGAAWGAVYHAEDAAESAKREKHVRDLLGIPGQYRVVAIIGLGYPAVEPPPKEMYPPERVFHEGRFTS